MPEDKLLTATEVAKMFQVELSTVYAWTHFRKIPCIRISSKMTRYPLKEIEAWIAGKMQAVGTPSASAQTRTGKRGSSRKNRNCNYAKQLVTEIKKEVLQQ